MSAGAAKAARPPALRPAVESGSVASVPASFIFPRTISIVFRLGNDKYSAPIRPVFAEISRQVLLELTRGNGQWQKDTVLNISGNIVLGPICTEFLLYSSGRFLSALVRGKFASKRLARLRRSIPMSVADENTNAGFDEMASCQAAVRAK
jgi:hypothetical protein